VLDDLLDEIERHASEIFVREQINGRWGSYALTDMPPALAIKNAFNFIRRGAWPIRLKTPDEP
jgi:hypothetical protein